MRKLIENYALIGDGETAALVGRDGSVDWLCWPRFDSDACLAALLGTDEHGSWRLAPIQSARVERRYQPDTLILETDFHTSDGAVRLTDFMPVGDGNSVLVRIVTGLRGSVRVRTVLNLRFDYGSLSPWLERHGKRALARTGPGLVVLHAPVVLSGDQQIIEAEFEVNEGDELSFELMYGASTEPAPDRIDAKRALTATQKYWREWVGQLKNPTPWPEAVRRSLITLKALIYRPSGGIVAAPTTSLPEAPAGEMNWDYRYAWLRDSTFTLSALLNAGFTEEAVAWRDWLLRAVAGDPDKMRIMYRIDGGRRLEEWTVAWLPGYRWSKPVRIGNAAAGQRQLDIYGEVMDTIHLAAQAGVERSNQERILEEAVVRHVETVWRKPDQGLWEARGEPRHYVYSKVMCWVAIDRFLDGRAKVADADPAMLSHMTDLRDCMHAEICQEGYDPGLGTFVDYYGGQELDASLLLLPLVGFLRIDDERIARTIAAIERDLVDEGLVRRWKARSPNPEGTFLACTCWLADCQALQGRREAAHETFERLLAVRNDLGLLAEEYNVPGRHLSGNFPQALSHLALIQTALSLSGPTLRRGRAADMGKAGDGGPCD
ncbi:glycoside hydrolase family 15 protein [Methylobacterium sp. Leaf117]|uniref:glycoside hydrolase family 15 protein n=1 Tax=Methylobacterium sp. Leaf117 TaxID=1736260 RepID=UPI0006FF114D|nr:glycoside hydrolase family 15 protein [Methylobacterium sp. Leaf117]KQP80266.1 glucoamylase [Methylobacterium sp. Leaf117]